MQCIVLEKCTEFYEKEKEKKKKLRAFESSDASHVYRLEWLGLHF